MALSLWCPDLLRRELAAPVFYFPNYLFLNFRSQKCIDWRLVILRQCPTVSYTSHSSYTLLIHSTFWSLQSRMLRRCTAIQLVRVSWDLHLIIRVPHFYPSVVLVFQEVFFAPASPSLIGRPFYKDLEKPTVSIRRSGFLISCCL